MSSVGAYLRGLRQKQGMSLDELSRATRVLHHYLEALESDNIGSLPAPVFTRGFIRAYCQAVGVAPDEALKLYDRIGVPAPDVTKVPAGAAVRVTAVAEVHRRQIVQEPDYLTVTPPGPSPQGEPREKRARGTLLISFVLLVVLGVAFFAVTLALQSGRQGDGDPGTGVASQFPAVSDAPAPSPAQAAPPAESPPLPPAVATQPAAPMQPAVPPAKPSPGAISSAPAPSVSPAPVTQASAGAPAAPPASAAASAPAAPKPAVAPSAVALPSASTTPNAAPAASVGSAPPAVSPLPAASSASMAAATTARGLGLPYRLIARTTETTWMRVRTEDGRTSEETIPANEIREWVSNGPFVISIGNAGGVSLELNGRPIPRLGASGSVVTRLVLPSDNP
jgi:cytoskeleton protein RodZ